MEAPTFCTGVAPAEPGIPDRHSSPPRPCSIAATITSSHTAPASARTRLPSMAMPLFLPTAPQSDRSGYRRSPGWSRQQTPVAGHRRRCGLRSPAAAQRRPPAFGAGACDQAPCHRSDSQRAGQRRQRHRLGDMRTGKRSEPTTARNGSLATAMPRSFDISADCEGNVEAVLQGVQQGGLLAGQARGSPVSTTRKLGVDCESVVSPETTAPSTWSRCR